MIYGMLRISSQESKGGIPPEETNFNVAIKKLVDNDNPQDNPVAFGTLITMSDAVSNLETMDLEEFKGNYETFTKMALGLNEKKIKNSPLYSRLIEASWPYLTQKVNINWHIMKPRSSFIFKLLKYF